MNTDSKVLNDYIDENTAMPLSSNKHSFITSSLCGSNACVGVAIVENEGVFVQDTKDLTRQPLSFDRAEWAAFVAGVKNGEFDVR